MPFAATRIARAADGLALAYAIAPAPGAPRIALLHSLALDRHFWNQVAAAIGGRAELLAMDCRGHGASGRDAGPTPVSRMADDLAAVLDDAGWDRALVCGCSMGGTIALAFAVAHPARCTALVPIDTTAWYGPEAPQAWGDRAAKAEEAGMAALLPFQHARWLSPAFREAHPEVEAAADAVFLANDVASYAAACRMLGQADLREAIAAIRVPTLVMVGTDDGATPPAMAEEIVRRIPGATLQPLEGARHLTPLERPAEIAAALLRLAGATPR
ncbi:alpha/beta fold hydrolase [Falsiroseomonas ponticola]|uniref:alpha/beta fold hydrolase n=1 Tax=Falsiroseomonas ponticola TaxID=2786951 RepID=UPI001932692A|nr:alpha/beta fold hydrolase [Roseomonas ponticola]